MSPGLQSSIRAVKVYQVRTCGLPIRVLAKASQDTEPTPVLH
jgi:hypothetical protein